MKTKGSEAISEEWIYDCVNPSQLRVALDKLSADKSKKNLKRLAEERLTMLTTGSTDVQKKEAEALRLKGNDFVKGEDYKKALEFYTLSIKADPTESTVFSNRALTHIRDVNYQKALDDANRAIFLNKENARGYQRRAEALMGLKQYRNAFVTAKALLKKDPANKIVIPRVAQYRV